MIIYNVNACLECLEYLFMKLVGGKHRTVCSMSRSEQTERLLVQNQFYANMTCNIWP